MNILLLGGAKRVSMARHFAKAAADRGLSVRLYSYELESHVAIAAAADVIVGKAWSDPGVYPHLQQVVREKEIDIVVPFVDGAVGVAARLCELCPGLFAPVCSVELAEQMFDKVTAASLFEKHQLPIPATWHGGAIDRPLIAKPRHGSASKGLITFDQHNKYAVEYVDLSNYLVQSRIDNREEYTVDCYVSVHTGEPLAIVPRKRISVLNGEVMQTETVIYPEVYDLAKNALERLGLRGAVTVQVIRDLDSDRVMIMEINPRLGGGAVCAVVAGANIPALIIAEALGEQPSPVCYRPYTEIVRYRQETIFYN